MSGKCYKNSKYKHFDELNFNEDDSNDSENPTRKEVKKLQFQNPGRFMDNFDPERSSREMRKVNRKIYRDTIRKNQMYDERGRLLENKADLCDCLTAACPGCHFPCPKCGSEKCGGECRCNRRWIYQEIEAEGGTYRKCFPGSEK